MYTLGIDIGSTTVKVAVLDKDNNILFSDYKRHFANIKETLKDLVQEAKDALGENEVNPCITGSGGLALAQLIDVPFTQEVVCVSEALQDYAPQTDVAMKLGSEDAKIIYFTRDRTAYERCMCRRKYRFFHRPDGYTSADRCIEVLTTMQGLRYHLSCKVWCICKRQIYSHSSNRGATKPNLAFHIPGRCQPDYIRSCMW